MRTYVPEDVPEEWRRWAMYVRTLWLTVFLLL